MKRIAGLAGSTSLLLVTGLVALDGPLRAAHLLRLALIVLLSVGIVLGIGYTLLAGVLIRRFFARPLAQPTSYPPVTVIKPLHGNEWALLHNLSTFCQQDYPGPVQFLFGVHDAADPALQVVEELRRLYPEASITVVADARLYGANRKISNILNMLPAAHYDVLVFADSDVSVGPDYLRNIVGELQAPGVGLVTCAYRGQPDPGFWPRLSAAAVNYQFIPGVVTGLALDLGHPCLGPTIAMRRATLEKIGGLAQFVHHLAEDHAIGEAVRKVGEKVVMPPFAIAHACAEASFAQLVTHELRWSRTIRMIDPACHLGTILIHPFALALLGLPLYGAQAWWWVPICASLLASLTLGLLSGRALRQSYRDIWLLPIWDVASFFIFVASFFSTCVTWRGFRFKVNGDGLLSPVQDE